MLKIVVVDTATSLESSANSLDLCEAYKKAVGDENVLFMDYRKLNAPNIAHKILNFEPDYVHLGKCETLKGGLVRTVKLASQKKIYFLHYYGDWRNEIQEWVVSLGKQCDITYFQHTHEPTIKKYKALGIKNIGFHHAGVNFNVYGIEEDIEKVYDFVFMGNNHTTLKLRGYEVRREVLEYLCKSYKVLIHGIGWEYLKDKATVRPFVINHAFRKAIQSARFQLNLSGVLDITLCCSWPRVMRGLAAGTHMLSPYMTGLQEYCPTMIYYKNKEEISKVIEKWGGIDTESIKYIKNNHTWEKRVHRLISDWLRLQNQVIDK